jgi:hypothetical protein
VLKWDVNPNKSRRADFLLAGTWPRHWGPWAGAPQRADPGSPAFSFEHAILAGAYPFVEKFRWANASNLLFATSAEKLVPVGHSLLFAARWTWQSPYELHVFQT